MKKKLPAFSIYCGDLLKDKNFLACDGEAKALWVWMLVHLHDMPDRGEFRLAPDLPPMTTAAIANLLTYPITKFETLLYQLDSNGVTTRVDGAIANRRMVRERKLHEIRSESGKKGMEARWQNHNKPITNELQNITSSSSSSSSSSDLSSDSDSDSEEKKKEKREKKEGITTTKVVGPPVAKSARAWEAYSTAFHQRYKTAPPPNARSFSLLCQLVDRLGIEEAPAVAAFYVNHNGTFYVERMHPVTLLVQDAEKLRTEWVTGRRMTRVEARSAEQGDAMREQVHRVRKLMQGGGYGPTRSS
jgi:hypothetical protein